MVSYVQMSTCGLLGSDMVNISTRYAEAALLVWPAAWTCAVYFYGGEVVSKRGMAKIQVAGGDDGVAEALMRELTISKLKSQG